MPRDFNRAERVGRQLQKELADLIRNQLKDPRLGMVTVQAVRLSRDLSHAKVYVTLFDAAERKQQLGLLKDAAPFLRREIGHRMRLRITPVLEFVYDESIEQGTHLSELIERALRQ
ncbi:MAG: 30S ribosome-binding factor RbfA [Gammaproteobacteria bacterium SHHR-1]